MSKSFTAITMLVAVFFALIFTSPVRANAESLPVWPEGPSVKATSAILIEASTGSILYEKNAKEARFPASTTKLMTVLLAIEQKQLTDTVVMSKESVYSMGWDASRVGMVQGEELSMEDSLYAILLASANEVCYAVGEFVAGGEILDFVDMMNRRANELGCVNSNYVNPHGLHDDNHYTCAYDLALVMQKCLEYPTFSHISNNHYYTLPETNLNGERVIAQTHQILRKKITCEGVFAGKTGHTAEAGNCLVTACERNGMTLIAVVMEEPTDSDCYKDTIALFDFGYSTFEMTGASLASGVKNAFPVLFSDEEAFVHKVTSDLSISDTVLVLPKGASFKDVVTSCKLSPVMEMWEGQNIIGEAVYYYAGREVGSADVIFTSDSYQVVDPAEIYLRTYKDTEEFDEIQYQILAGTYVEEEAVKDLRPVIIGCIVGILFLSAGIFVLFGIFVKGSK